MLRWYQEEAVNSIFRYFEREKGNPLIAAPGGTGKSHIISGFIQRAFGLFANQRFMILTHVKELIEQDVDKLIKAWPLAPLGVYSASVGRKDTHAPITFGGVASVVRAVELFGHIDLVIVDLYPFEEISELAVTEDAIEMIDIGGVSLIRAAAKN